MSSKQTEYKPDPRTAIKHCRCPHKGQDKRYGDQLRVHNRTNQKEDKHNQGWRCTVCGVEK
jgi:hypothetical protein